MRFWVLAMAALLLAACDQVTIAEPEATWTGSIGRLVAHDGDPAALEFVHLDGAGPEQGRMTLVEIDDADLDQAARLETLVQPPRMESLQARLVTTGDIDAGALCWLRFEARAVQPQVELGLGRLSITVRPSAPDVEPMFYRSIYIDPVWTPIDLAFVTSSGLGAGDAEIVFGVGTQLQVVDVGGVSMRCFGQGDRPADLPETTFSYAGREAEAPWRATAESQIERYRKGDLAITVTDADGQPVTDAEIHIQMNRHAFKFGAVVEAEQLAGISEENGEKTTAYRKNLRELFNTVTFEDGLSWSAWADPADRQVTEDALAWVRSLGLDLRGRGLASADRSELPTDLQDKQDDPEAIREAVHAGITTTAGELDGRVVSWDVVDRPREHHDLLNLLGSNELATWFQLARSATPNAELVLNESDILAGDRMAELATLLGNLIAADVPIDRIGIQGQFGAQPPSIQVLGDRLDQLASFDLPLVVTAFDMATSDKQLLEDFTRDFLTLAFSHPAIQGFVFGAFWEGEESSPGASIYRRDGTLSPVGKLYRDLVRRTWWTDIAARSNADGELTTRVYQGDYTISARKNDQSTMATLSLGPDGANLALTLSNAKGDDDRSL
ncbi:MAG: endo-1,4-beta-xylanase [Geminicoccaceae bacterium]